MELPRYDLETHCGGITETFRWKDISFVRYLIEVMERGDDLVIHRTDDDALYGVQYPEEGK